ncbi:MAG: lysophospholipid acyltransferase family protein [Thermodesulfobacteriota bacterium]
MIRTIFVHLNVILSFLILVILQGLAAIVDPSRDLAHNVARIWGRWILLSGGIRVCVKGIENILQGRPQVFFCNHSSYFDICCLLAYLPVQYRWVAKEELFHIPLFGAAMRLGGYIPIDRSNARKAHRSMLAAVERIKAGTSIVIFPEGTRSKGRYLQAFKSGGAVLALKARVPVVPLVILGTEKVLPRGTLRVGRGAVEIRIGEPISTEGLTMRDKRTLLSRVRQTMLAMSDGAGCRDPKDVGSRSEKP